MLPPGWSKIPDFGVSIIRNRPDCIDNMKIVDAVVESKRFAGAIKSFLTFKSIFHRDTILQLWFENGIGAGVFFQILMSKLVRAPRNTYNGILS